MGIKTPCENNRTLIKHAHSTARTGCDNGTPYIINTIPTGFKTSKFFKNL